MRLAACIAAAAVVAVCAGAGWWAWRPAGPADEQGRAWVAAFVETLASPGTLGARGPAVAALFPGLQAEAREGCVNEWSLQDSSAPVVMRQSLELGRLPGESCDQAEFGTLSTTLRISKGVAPEIMAERFTERFGPPEIDRGATSGGAASSTWQVLDGIFVTMKEPARADARTFSVLFVRFLGSADHMATETEALAWLDRTVDLFAGPALARARGKAAVALVGARMRSLSDDGAGCPTMFESELVARGPLVSGASLYLDRPAGGRCEDATASLLSLFVWRQGPVTAEALVTRLGARLGPPAVSRRFDRDDINYRWKTSGGMSVEVVEGLSGGMRRWLLVRATR